MLKTIIFPKDLSKLNKKGLPEPQYEEPAQENFLKSEKYINIVDKAFNHRNARNSSKNMVKSINKHSSQ